MASTKTLSPQSPIVIVLTVNQAGALEQIASQYEKNWGMMRHVVRLSSGREMRRKYGFIAAESAILRRFAEDAARQASTSGQESSGITFTLRAVIALWGRLLAGLHSKRTRRRLSVAHLVLREEIGAKFREAIKEASCQDPALIENELSTRRPSEAEWMRQALRTGDDSDAAGPECGRVKAAETN